MDIEPEPELFQELILDEEDQAAGFETAAEMDPHIELEHLKRQNYRLQTFLDTTLDEQKDHKNDNEAVKNSFSQERNNIFVRGGNSWTPDHQGGHFYRDTYRQPRQKEVHNNPGENLYRDSNRQSRWKNEPNHPGGNPYKNNDRTISNIYLSKLNNKL